jgi:sigma-E factor negative regulatory protein RseA
MKDRISMLMDGELDRRDAASALDALRRDGEALQAWHTYHLIGDSLRDCRLLSAGFEARLGKRLADEPTVLAPRRLPREPRLRFALSAAASVAAVALVGWLAFAPQKAGEQETLAKAGGERRAAAAAPVAQQPAAPVIVPLPSAANDYLLAHQGFSPRLDLQGMAPYVRTVSDSSQEGR